MQATRPATKRPAWNASTKAKPAPASARTTTIRRIGGGYAPSPAATTRANTTRTAARTAMSRVEGSSIPRMATRTTPAMRTKLPATRSVRSGTQTTTAPTPAPEDTPRPSKVAHVSDGPVFKSSQHSESASTKVDRDELAQLKERNAALSAALEEKTTQLDVALQEVSELKVRLEASSIEQEEVLRNLEDLIKMQHEIFNQFSHKYESETDKAEQRSCIGVNVQHQATAKVPDEINHEEKEEGDSMNGNARMIEDVLAEERSQQQTPHAQLQKSVDYSEKNRNRAGWSVFQDLIEEEKSDQCPLFDELMKMDQLTEQEQNQEDWDFFEEFLKEERLVQQKENEELQTSGRLREMEHDQLAWNLFEDLMKERKLKDGCLSIGRPHHVFQAAPNDLITSLPKQESIISSLKSVGPSHS